MPGSVTLTSHGNVKEDQQRFLALLGQPPARLTVEQAAWVLNCQPHDIPVLVATRLVRPLGHPAANATKYFATREVLELAHDRSWLAKITSTVSEHWKSKNARKAVGLAAEPSGQPASFELLAADGH